MEKSVYNWAIRRSKQLNDPASWESQTFRDRYKLRYSSIIFNLQTSEQFRKKVLDEDIKSSTIALMTSTGMQPEGVHATAIEKREESLQRKMKAAKEHFEGVFKCGRCKSKKTTYYQMQTRCEVLLLATSGLRSRADTFSVRFKTSLLTQSQRRSADEPMTTFVTCLECEKRWKF